MRPRCIIIGGGGHARVLIDTLQQSGTADLHGILDPQTVGTMIYGVAVLGGDELLPTIAADVTHFVIGLGGTQNNSPRQRLFEAALAHRLLPLSVIHPTAICSPRADLAAGVQILAGAIVNAGAQLGQNVLVNSGAIVEHDCSIADHVHIATGARLAGGVKVGLGAHIGAGATIRQYVTIGSRSVVGAGAVVIRDVLPETVVVGIPAKALEKS